MSAPDPAPLVAVKLTPVGRAQTFLAWRSRGRAPRRAPATASSCRPTADRRSARSSAASRSSTTSGGRAADSPQRVVRLATREDIVARLKHQQREQEAYRIALLKIRERGLGMKLTRVEQAFDGSRLIFYFTADGRVDFRELVRELAAEFRTRIEMRQIGVRDEAKMLGGYGTCGRPLCCTTFLQSFEPVSIKMAKQQDLSLNPSKLSGLCGRLKCCLRYELPNAKGVQHGGCGSEGGCDNPSGCGTGGCGSACGCGGCGGRAEAAVTDGHAMKPRVAITVGDPAGIGPEIAARAAADRARARRRASRSSTRRPTARRFAPGVLSAEAGRAAYDTIVRAVDDAQRGDVAGDRDGAGQQGSVPAGRPAVERATPICSRTSPARRTSR